MNAKQIAVGDSCSASFGAAIGGFSRACVKHDLSVDDAIICLSIGFKAMAQAWLFTCFKEDTPARVRRTMMIELLMAVFDDFTKLIDRLDEKGSAEMMAEVNTIKNITAALNAIVAYEAKKAKS